MSRYSEAAKRRWADPEYKAKRSMAFSEYMKRRWADPKYRENKTRSLKKMWANPEHREKMAKIHQSPEFREKRSTIQTELWQDPEYRVMMSMVHTERQTELWQDPEYRDRMSGENSPTWRGGISFIPYPPDFNEYLKKMIRKRDGCKCVLCGAIDSLQIHHINYDKMDSRPQNLITLCVPCHGKTGYDRGLWQSGLSLLIANTYF